ncbi:MAG TPA: archease [Nitrospiria bacterium]|jgi:tRNA nucleotidyltransferase (CCA-adding enzyme)
MKNHWEHFPHEADMGVRGIGASKEEAFEEAAKALTSVITDLGTVCPKEMIHLSGEGPDDDLCLAEWLNQLIFEMATRKMLFSDFKLKMRGHRFEADIWGETINVEKHQPAVEVKGATFTALGVKQSSDGFWVAQCVVDV